MAGSRGGCSTRSGETARQRATGEHARIQAARIQAARIQAARISGRRGLAGAPARSADAKRLGLLCAAPGRAAEHPLPPNPSLLWQEMREV